MTNLFPKPHILLDSEIFFGSKPAEDRISLIKHISKESILFEIVALNYRLKPKDSIRIDNSLETQIRELKYFTQNEFLYNSYFNIYKKRIYSDKKYDIIFCRQSCIYAIEEIVTSKEMTHIEGFEMGHIEIWDAIVRYLLAVNYAVSRISSKPNFSDNNEEKRTIEALNPKLIPLNELVVETNPIYTPYRGYWLLKHFEKHSEYGKYITEFFRLKYDLEPSEFIYELLSMYVVNNHENPDFNFFYNLEDNQNQLFKCLSERIENNEIHKFLSIRKSPFIDVGKNQYLIADNTFLIEKTYNQFLNDFWFDYIKHKKNENGKSMFTIQEYRSEFGYFFESYISMVLKYCFEKYKYSELFLFDQLNVDSPNGTIELADVYLRYNNRILIGQVKSGNIYDLEKYGGDTDSLYKNDRDKFFANFGVNQIVNSIKSLEENIDKIDSKFFCCKSHKIYPCIIVNDKALQTPLMADIFNQRFFELLNLEYKNPKLKIHSLSIIHVSDLELIENELNQNPKLIWQLLESNIRDKKFIPPFYYTLTSKLRKRNVPPKVMNLFKELITQYNPN